MVHTPPQLSVLVVLWDMLGPALPRGVLGLSDPDVHHIDGQWTMVVGGFSATFRNRLYRATLPLGHPLSLEGWRLDTGRLAVARPLVEDPPPGRWDRGGMHTPCYVPPAHGYPARIYYAGRSGTRHYGPGSCYAIGLLTRRDDGSWQPAPAPVLLGRPERPSALEPRVIVTDTGFRMWFQSTVHEVGPGEQPDFELHVTDSKDGVTWGEPSRFSTVAEGFFDNTLARTPDGWEMLLARGTNLHGTPGFPAQGLWWMRADAPSRERAAWSAPVRILDTDTPDTARWLGHGVCGPSIASDGTRRLVFFTGTHRGRVFWREALSRLAVHRRPAVPAPYHLATGGASLRG